MQCWNLWHRLRIATESVLLNAFPLHIYYGKNQGRLDLQRGQRLWPRENWILKKKLLILLQTDDSYVKSFEDLDFPASGEIEAVEVFTICCAHSSGCDNIVQFWRDTIPVNQCLGDCRLYFKNRSFSANIDCFYFYDSRKIPDLNKAWTVREWKLRKNWPFKAASWVLKELASDSHSIEPSRVIQISQKSADIDENSDRNKAFWDALKHFISDNR